jgi:hypothetical protein
MFFPILVLDILSSVIKRKQFQMTIHPNREGFSYAMALIPSSWLVAEAGLSRERIKNGLNSGGKVGGEPFALRDQRQT